MTAFAIHLKISCTLQTISFALHISLNIIEKIKIFKRIKTYEQTDIYLCFFFYSVTEAQQRSKQAQLLDQDWPQ